MTITPTKQQVILARHWVRAFYNFRRSARVNSWSFVLWF